MLSSSYVQSGLDPEDLRDREGAARLIGLLPPSIGFGMHFHFAMSNLGHEPWYEQAQAYCTFSSEFSKKIGRPLAILDFGGGWEPYTFVSNEIPARLSQLMTLVRSEFGHQELLPCVQFEPGKSISEAAGGVITRIMCIRHRKVEEPSGSISDTCRAVIVDTTVADISCPHLHPVFWRPAPGRLPLVGVQDDGDPLLQESAESLPVIPPQELSSSNCWIPLPPGNDAIWGRTCMEFDRIGGTQQFQLPAEARPGDLLLFSFVGAYDFTNSYAFGDGIGRDMHVVE